MPIELKVPEVGESVTEVYIGEWRISEGDSVERDDNVVEVESEKATFDIPAPAAGVLSRIVKQSGETAKVGETIAYIDEQKVAGKKGAAARPSQSDRKSSESKEKPEPPRSRPAEREDRRASRNEPTPAAKAAREKEDSRRVMPSARRALAERGLSPEDVAPTGPGGRILKEDVERQAEMEPAAREKDDAAHAGSAPGREEEVVRMSPIRRRIAERLVEAQRNAALLTTFNEVDMSHVQQLRRQHQDAFREKYGIKLGLMSFFVKAAVDALRLCPRLNAEIRDTDIVYRNYCDIGIAVSSERGLVVPVLRDAERLSFAEIEQAIDDFARRAGDGKLAVEELTGGTFTITNGGIFGSLLSTPIVNPPQSGVLGLHAIQERPVVRDGAIVARPMMYVALTYDHRIVDGREAVTFLRRIKETVEEPARMLLEV